MPTPVLDRADEILRATAMTVVSTVYPSTCSQEDLSVRASAVRDAAYLAAGCREALQVLPADSGRCPLLHAVRDAARGLRDRLADCTADVDLSGELATLRELAMRLTRIDDDDETLAATLWEHRAAAYLAYHRLDMAYQQVHARLRTT